jgi:hypothetical protein
MQEPWIKEFDTQLMSEQGITMDGHNYKMVYKKKPSQNHAKK